MNNMGERIRELRTALGLNQAEFAKRLGVTGAAVSAYENDIRLPSYEILLKIARLFHVTTDELLCGGSRSTVDVSALTARQRGTVQELVSAFTVANRCVEALRGGEQPARLLGELGLDALGGE